MNAPPFLRPSFIPLLSLLLAAPAASAAVIPGLLQASGNLQVDVFSSASMSVVSDGSVVGDTVRGSVIASDLELLENGGELVELVGHVAGRHFVVRDEGTFLRYVSSSTMDMGWTRGTAAAGDDVQTSASAGTIFDFEITDVPMKATIKWGDFSSFEAGIVLKDTDTDQEFFSYPNAGTFPLASVVLPPGNYRLTAGIGLDTTNAATLDNTLAVEFTITEEPEPSPLPDPVRPAEGCYTHPDIFTAREGGTLLAPSTPQVLAETDLGNGTTEFRITTSVENLGNAPWPEVDVELADSIPGEPDLEILSTLPAFAVSANATAGPPPGSEAVVRVATADAATLRASILDGSRFRLSGSEQPVFRYPVRPLGTEDFEPRPSLSPAVTFVSFLEAPLFGAGTIIIEWEEFYSLPLLTIIEEVPIGEDLISRAQGFDRLFPMLVADVVLAGKNFNVVPFQTETLPARELTFFDLMKDGQIEVDFVPEAHPDDLGVTQIPETRQTGNGLGVTGFFPAPIPFAFNDVEVSSGITASGSFGFRPKAIDVDLEMRDGDLKRFEVRTRYCADCNLLLETEEGADNSAEPIVGQEATLLDLEFMNIHLPAGFSFTPRLVLTAGADISAPTALSLPLTAGLDIDITAGVRDGAPYYDSAFTEIPLQVADPGIHEALGVQAEAWLDCEIKALFGAAEGTFNTGPTLGAKAKAIFEVTPVDDPWWSVDATLEAFAGMEFNLLGFVDIIDAEHILDCWSLSPFFPFDAGGPLMLPSPSKSFTPAPGFKAIGEPRTRWVRSLLNDSVGLGNGESFAIALEGSDDLLAGTATLTDTTIARYSPEGDLVWALDPTVQMLAGHAVAEPDGGFTALSVRRNTVRIARFDGDGAVIWKRSISGTDGDQWFETVDLARREGPGGAAEYFVLGQGFGSSLGSFQTVLLKLDATGNVIWANHYPILPLATEGTTATPGGFALTSAGDVLIGGQTAADVPAPGTIGTNITQNAFVMKVDGDTGTAAWSTLVALPNSTTFTAVSEGPNGNIFAGGNSLRGVLSELPSMIVAKLDANGTLVDSVLIGSSSASDLAPHGGETPYDTIRDMEWIDGQMWVCGQIGLYNAGGVGGVANGASAFTAMISENLDVSRFVIHAGPSTDSFHDVHPTPHGLFVAGTSESFHRWPLGAPFEGNGNPVSFLAMMLPWEGRARFHPASAGAPVENEFGEPSRGSHFVLPRVRAASQYTFSTNQGLFAGLGQINVTDDATAAGTVVPEPFMTTVGTFPLSPVVYTPEEYKALEFMPESLITDFDSYLQWYQVDEDSDDDGDDLPAGAEHFLGTDLLRADYGVIQFDYLVDEVTEEPFVRFTMPRAKLAAPDVPQVRSSPTLQGFLERTDFTSSTSPLDAKRDWLFLEGPAIGEKDFFELIFNP